MMSWKPPESEEAWQECLTAYLDGEMEPDDCHALELYLEKDSDRAKQLHEMRRLSDVMQEWRVEAPEPNLSFIREIEKVQEKETGRVRTTRFASLFAGARFRWAFHTAVFLVGVLTGVLGGPLMQRAGVSAKPNEPLSLAPATVIRPEVVNIAISPTQADGLLREVQAGNLRERVISQMKNGNWEEARATYKSLRDAFSDTLVFQELQKDTRLSKSERFLDRRI
jgi:anti-sigma factor RsiW